MRAGRWVHAKQVNAAAVRRVGADVRVGRGLRRRTNRRRVRRVGMNRPRIRRVGMSRRRGEQRCGL